MSALRPVKGWIPPRLPPTPTQVAAHAQRMSLAASVAAFMATKVGDPEIIDQLNTSACGGFGLVQGEHVGRQALGLPPRPILSPMIPYWAARREALSADSEITDSGIDMDSLVAAANDFGACTMADDPFDEARINERPGDVAMLAAQQVHCTLEPIIETGAALWLAIQHAVCVERLPVIIALEVVPAFDNAGQTGGIVDDPSGVSRGGHVNCIFEVDPAVGGRTANSWGVGEWTPDGTAWLTPRFIESRVMWAGALRLQP